MKKLLSLLGVVAFGSVASATVVACGTNDQAEDLNAYTLNGKTFEVKLDSFTSNKAESLWGKNSIGALYSTLWSINNKPAHGEYTIQNQEIAAYLTKGESLNRNQIDNGSDVTLNDQLESEKHQDGKTDWHTDVLKSGDVIVFQMTATIYGKGGAVVETVDENITINIVA